MKRLALAAVLVTTFAAGAYAAAQTGSLHLPNDWRIAAPAGPVGTTGTLPQGIVLARGHAGDDHPGAIAATLVGSIRRRSLIPI
ncbi:MAG: hypothetical protein NVSMB64_22480 [Candidatus Velthaea sp.]